MFQFVGRAALIVPWFFAVSLWGLLMSLWRWGDPSNGHRVAQVLCWGALPLMGIRVHQEETDRLAAAQPCVYVANHQTNADVFILSPVYPERTVVIGKKELLAIPLFGLFFKASGNILLDRSSHDKAIEGMEAAARKIREDRISVWLFPEGHRNPQGPMMPFKKGAFHLAILAGVPVVPVVAQNYLHALDLKRWRMPGGDITVRALEPVASEGHTVESLMAEVRSRMEQALARLNGA
ncbi:MAG TPA: lysophospholipid acyltransferase family protein [Candidatus Xenobia bacterium]|jgi:1-acyl-sn-glycerol-3-phosphate acyltransferase